ncbi:hypothetical protein C8Q80DRAFT_1195009 [Daedaleopsis nitida]|nr:hypothetical protein C8Q80DRAFT_1195009 [Daedaleopsis nitida]
MSSISTYDESQHSHLQDSSDLGTSQDREVTPSWEPRNLCIALEYASKRASLHERQIKDLGNKLELDLSNSRAIENLLHEVFTGIQQTRDRADFSLSHTVPHITNTLDEDLAVLVELEEQLPEVGSQIRDIRKVYDLGRDKAKQLMSSLEWLNTPVSQRLRTIIFTPNAPVSKRWKVLVRTVFALVFLACLWIVWITVRGAIRAHRERLMWGSGLIS